MHHTKDKGDLGVLKAKAEVCSQGFVILSVESEHMPFDFVAYNPETESFKRIQVKYRSLSKDKKSIAVDVRSRYADRHGCHVKNFEAKTAAMDVICVYCPELDSCFFLDPKKLDIKNEFTLRLDVDRKQKNTRLASEYVKMPS